MLYLNKRRLLMKPIIAITTRTLNNEQKDRYITQETYCKALDTHGASYISVTPNKENNYTHIVSMCDGLLVSGGGDIDASYYNEENHEKGVSTFREEEKHRIMFEGIACWPWLRVTSTGLKSRGINMVTTIYADAFGFIYEDFELISYSDSLWYLL